MTYMAQGPSLCQVLDLEKSPSAHTKIVFGMNKGKICVIHGLPSLYQIIGDPFSHRHMKRIKAVYLLRRLVDFAFRLTIRNARKALHCTPREFWGWL